MDNDFHDKLKRLYSAPETSPLSENKFTKPLTQPERKEVGDLDNWRNLNIHAMLVRELIDQHRQNPSTDLIDQVEAMLDHMAESWKTLGKLELAKFNVSQNENEQAQTREDVENTFGAALNALLSKAWDAKSRRDKVALLNSLLVSHEELQRSEKLRHISGFMKKCRIDFINTKPDTKE